ncbi:MAG: MFS transporter [Acidobacteria bacterium]|nr:MFS transporter [Acidobacteriota bacterium]
MLPLGSDPVAKIRRRLIPFLFVLYVVAYLDRINVSFAALQMNEALGFTSAVYGLGAGVFFISYVLLEVPSNLILNRVGVRTWIARIMITWGLASSAMVFVQGTWSFYGLRFLLGAAEAGFFPGIILYLTRWFPAADRGRAIALFMTATALAGIIGGPLSGGLLSLEGVGGLHGWQWLFLLEGLPAVILGFCVLAWLPDGPAEAGWLEPAEREWLAARLREDEEAGQATAHAAFWPALRSGRLWLLATLYFSIVITFYGVSFWLPQILQSLSKLGDLQVAFLSALPYVGAAIGMVVIAQRSDRTGRRAGLVSASACIGAVGFAGAALVESPAASLAALSVAALGVWGTLGPFWAMPPVFLRGAAAAGGIAVINSVGNIGGFVGPYAVGAVRELTGDFAAGLWLMAGSLVVAASIAAALARTESRA